MCIRDSFTTVRLCWDYLPAFVVLNACKYISVHLCCLTVQENLRNIQIVPLLINFAAVAGVLNVPLIDNCANEKHNLLIAQIHRMHTAVHAHGSQKMRKGKWDSKGLGVRCVWRGYLLLVCHISTIFDCFVYQHQMGKNMSDTLKNQTEVGGVLLPLVTVGVAHASAAVARPAPLLQLFQPIATLDSLHWKTDLTASTHYLLNHFISDAYDLLGQYLVECQQHCLTWAERHCENCCCCMKPNIWPRPTFCNLDNIICYWELASLVRSVCALISISLFVWWLNIVLVFY